jgi:hypothetical protein
MWSCAPAACPTWQPYITRSWHDYRRESTTRRLKHTSRAFQLIVCSALGCCEHKAAELKRMQICSRINGVKSQRERKQKVQLAADLLSTLRSMHTRVRINTLSSCWFSPGRNELNSHVRFAFWIETSCSRVRPLLMGKHEYAIWDAALRESRVDVDVIKWARGIQQLRRRRQSQSREALQRPRRRRLLLGARRALSETMFGSECMR